MNHADHVTLLRGGAPGPGGVWADFGSGAGAFTLALAELVGPTGTIHSIDRERGALRAQERAMRSLFPRNVVHYHVADFTQPLDLPPLDGLVMANALHFQPDPGEVVQRLKRYLKPEGRWLLVEYNLTVSNAAVPYPVSCASWEALAARCGFRHTQLLVTRPSHYLSEIYSAASW
jgi:ubiquinone/menaquinone biosynthesis C-methylase UbiE